MSISISLSSVILSKLGTFLGSLFLLYVQYCRE